MGRLSLPDGAAMPGMQGIAPLQTIAPPPPLPTPRALIRGINLAAPLLADGSWPIRDQLHRGTCNAFAVVAAEELADFHATGTLTEYAEEDLYRAIRDVPLSDTDVDPDKVDQDKMARTGATFLAQAKVAIARGGLVRAVNGQAYVTDPLVPPNYVAPAPIRPPRPVNTDQAYETRVARSPAVMPAIDWEVPPVGEMRLGARIMQALIDKKPVVAAFPVLDPPGSEVFTSAPARRFGRAGYPPEASLHETAHATGGHSICIVGYAPKSTTELDGWFIFRNSLGRWAFARDCRLDTRAPRAPAPGYGLISVHDVERFCWEYLYRA